MDNGKQRTREILERLVLQTQPYHNLNGTPPPHVLPQHYDQALDSIGEIMREQYREGWNALMRQSIQDKIMPVDKFGNPPYVLLNDLVGRWESK